MALELDASDCEGKDVLVIEDIVDSGKTIEFLRRHLKKKGLSVRCCTLMDKGRAGQKAEFTGFSGAAHIS